ncbi:hypothetical protein TKK_0007760 [Trichogramma kaykai]
MKSFVVLAALVAVASAGLLPQQRQFQPIIVSDFSGNRQQPQQQTYHQVNQHNNNVVLVRETPNNNIGLEGYNFAYELSDGQTRQEDSRIQVYGPEQAANRVSGSYSYVGDDGVTYTISYVADENGYRASGAHLPVAPVA